MSYADLSEYRRKLLQYPKESVGAMRTGYMYAFYYDFDVTDYSNDIVRYFDHLPLAFITQVISKHNMMQGINLHHMPLKIREMWHQRIKFVARIGQMLRLGRKIDRMSWLNYQRMVIIFRDSKYAVRNYKIGNIKDVRQIPLDQIDELMQYYAQTYYGASYSQMVSQFVQRKSR
jgi:hypothetical protein